MSRPLSVIVPTLDEGAVIRTLLEALQPLRRLGGELIVVDGGSGDATPSLAAPLADRVLECEPGRAMPMNHGAAVARGDWLWFLHADAGLEGAATGYLDTIRGCGRDWGRFDVRLEATGPLFRLIGTMMNLRSRLTGIATGDQGLFVRRALFESLGGFAPIALMEDIELSRRLRRRQRPACPRLRLSASARRWQRDGVLRTILLMWRLRLAYFLGADPQRLAEAYRPCGSPTREY